MLRKFLMTVVSVIAIAGPRVAFAGCGGDGGDGGTDGGTTTTVNLNAEPSSFSSMTTQELIDLNDFVNAMNQAGNSSLINTPAYSKLREELTSRQDGGAQETSETATTRTTSRTVGRVGFAATRTAAVSVKAVEDDCSCSNETKKVDKGLKCHPKPAKAKPTAEVPDNVCDPKLLKFNQSAVRKALKDPKVRKQIEAFGSPLLKKMLQTALADQAATPATTTQ